MRITPGLTTAERFDTSRSGAILLDGTEGVVISRNELTNLDGNGVSINGYNRGLVIDRNEFSWIGDSAMASWGHTGYCLNANCTRKLPYKVGPDSTLTTQG